MWRYEKCKPLIVPNLPSGWFVDVYKVTSGDSGEKYYVQILTGAHGTTPVESTYICNCGDAMIHGMNLLAIATEGTGCKHAKNLAEFLEEKHSKVSGK